MNIIQTDRPKLNTPKRLIQPGNSKLPSLMMFNIPASKEMRKGSAEDATATKRTVST